ncbi:MAG: hypothetical protein DMD26_04100 [Gemmatimonadetes bacterium]|nr:MAG: hypothetical protein DMD26_04100 [Gemmatimonadota bacterium]
MPLFSLWLGFPGDSQDYRAMASGYARIAMLTHVRHSYPPGIVALPRAAAATQRPHADFG